MAGRDGTPIPLSRFGVFVAQIESIAASARFQPPDPTLCFDLLSEFVSALDDEPREAIVQWQRKCEDALYSLLVLGAKRPVRHLASLAMARVIAKGDSISVYSRASSLQGWLADGRRSEPLAVSGVAQCLGELYCLFGRKLTSGLAETTSIAAKLMRLNEDFVRQDVMQMLHHALEGSDSAGPAVAYSEAYRIVIRVGVVDKACTVRLAAAKCLKSFADIGGPGLGITDLENSASFCLKALEDPLPFIRDAFAETLGTLLALGMNPTQMKQTRKTSIARKKLEDGLQKYLVLPFLRASGVRAKELRIGLTLSWVFFLQVVRVRYGLSHTELQHFALQAVDMLQENSILEAQSLACVLYIVRVGVIDQMTESAQRSFLVLLGKQLESSGFSPSKGVATLRILSYLLAVLGEVPGEFKELLDGTVVAALSHASANVRVEAALTLRGLVEVDPTCIGGLISYGITTLYALRDSLHLGKGSMLRFELDSLHGQAAVLSAIVSTSPQLLLGYPARLPSSVFEVSKKMLIEFSRNPVVACGQKEAGWLLLGSLIASMPKEELEDRVFDVLLLWTDSLGRYPGNQAHQPEDLISEIRVMSSAIEALTAFIRSFISSTVVAANKTVLLQPVLFYLSGALSYISSLYSSNYENVMPALDLFTIRTLSAYQYLSDPMVYKGDHAKIIQICTSPFRDPSGFEESSCLRLLLDKKDACLGPWTPGRDWFEDELRAFDGGRDGILPCMWENHISTFPQPNTIGKMLVNQMLLCFGCIFAAQEKNEKLKLLNIIDQCLKSGKKQSWRSASVTNACVALLAGLKALAVSRPQSLDIEMLSLTHSILQGILAEGEICSAQRRASSEGLGLLGRLGNDSFAARMTRSILGELAAASDPFYIGSLAFSLGCIHRSAGGMALSTLVPSTVSSISSLARSSNACLQQWSLHALLLTIEAAGLSYMSHVQVTLSLALEILLSEDSRKVNIRQAIGRLINAIIAVLGPELSPASTFFSRCKSVVAEISFGQETSTLVECVRFTQQLVLFSPQAVSVHSHVRTLLPTLSSKQPTLRKLAVSTLKHLIETDPDAVIDEQIEENLFVMLDDETDSKIGNLVRKTISRLLTVSCPAHPSRWLNICREMVLAASSKNIDSAGLHLNGVSDGDPKLYYDEDNENMIANSSAESKQGPTPSRFALQRDKHLRYRTRIFAAECLSLLPTAVGTDPAHFDLTLANERQKDSYTQDWLVLHLQELVSIAYQISTSQFERLQPVGLRLLISIMDKFEKTPDPELPEHHLLEQSQAQLVSAIRSSVMLSSGPLLLEAGLQLAEKVLTSNVLRGDQVALQRMFSLISHPLNDFKDLYYPSFAEWVACKIKIRLLAAHASVRCHAYNLLRVNKSLPEEYRQLLPMFSESSRFLGYCWISVLKDYCYMRCGLQSKSGYKPFLDGIQSLLVSSKVQECLDLAWPSFLLATVSDAIPDSFDMQKFLQYETDDLGKALFVSGYSMVRLSLKEFHFLWGLALLALFQDQLAGCGHAMSLLCHDKFVASCEMTPEEIKSTKLAESPLMVFQSLSTKMFLSLDYLTLDICQELLQVLVYAKKNSDSWDYFSIMLFSQLMLSCPRSYFEKEDFLSMATELCIKHLFKVNESNYDDLPQNQPCREDALSALVSGAEKIAFYLNLKNCWMSIMALLSASYECVGRALNDSLMSKFVGFIRNVYPLMMTWFIDDAKCEAGNTSILLGAWANVVCSMYYSCLKSMHRDSSSKLVRKKFTFCLEEVISVAQLAHGTQFRHKDSDRTQFCSLYLTCIKCIQKAVTDISEQVQAIGVHILRSSAQKKPDSDSAKNFESFLLFFIGELLDDVLMLMHRRLNGRMSWEGVAILEDCLRLLFLFQGFSHESKYVQPAIAILLEAIVMVFSAFDKVPSKELLQIKNGTTVIVSHLVQTPAAIHIKDILISMPATKRQQLQDIIRSSTISSQIEIHTKPIDPPLVKLPLKPELDCPDPLPSVVPSHGNFSGAKDHDSGVDVEKDDDDDDWDAYQSFPASNIASDLIDKGASKHDSSSNLSVLEGGRRSDELQNYQETSVSETQIEFDDQGGELVDKNVTVKEHDSKQICEQSANESKQICEQSGNESTPQDQNDDSGEPEVILSNIIAKDSPKGLAETGGKSGSSVQHVEFMSSCEGIPTCENTSKVNQNVTDTTVFTEDHPVIRKISGNHNDDENPMEGPVNQASCEDEVIELDAPSSASGVHVVTIGGQKSSGNHSGGTLESTSIPSETNDTKNDSSSGSSIPHKVAE